MCTLFTTKKKNKVFCQKFSFCDWGVHVTISENLSCIQITRAQFATPQVLHFSGFLRVHVKRKNLCGYDAKMSDIRCGNLPQCAPFFVDLAPGRFCFMLCFCSLYWFLLFLYFYYNIGVYEFAVVVFCIVWPRCKDVEVGEVTLSSRME